ncbi:MAG: hypothetical protein J6V36_02940 [Clostridia bacterium]|nr:hypothetical protein [Clostridia bacterium]
MDKREYISDEQIVLRANAAVKLAIEKKKALGIPVVVYEPETQNIYNEYPDGTRKLIGKRKFAERYSERIKKQ